MNSFGRKISGSHLTSAGFMGRDHNSVIRTNSYVLNKVHALKKKLIQCGQEHLSYEMKPNKNFVMRLSLAAYELTRLVVVEHLYRDTFFKDYFILSCINKDEC